MKIYVGIYEVWEFNDYEDPAHWTESVRAFTALEGARAGMPVKPGDEESPKLVPTMRNGKRNGKFWPTCQNLKEQYRWVVSSCYDDSDPAYPDDLDNCPVASYREARYSIYECQV